MLSCGLDRALWFWLIGLGLLLVKSNQNVVLTCKSVSSYVPSIQAKIEYFLLLLLMDRLNKVTKSYSCAKMGQISPISTYLLLLIDFPNPLCTAVANYYFFNAYFMLANALEKSPSSVEVAIVIIVNSCIKLCCHAVCSD